MRKAKSLADSAANALRTRLVRNYDTFGLNRGIKTRNRLVLCKAHQKAVDDMRKCITYAPLERADAFKSLPHQHQLEVFHVLAGGPVRVPLDGTGQANGERELLRPYTRQEAIERLGCAKCPACQEATRLAAAEKNRAKREAKAKAGSTVLLKADNAPRKVRLKAAHKPEKKPKRIPTPPKERVEKKPERFKPAPGLARYAYQVAKSGPWLELPGLFDSPAAARRAAADKEMLLVDLSKLRHYKDYSETSLRDAQNSEDRKAMAQITVRPVSIPV